MISRFALLVSALLFAAPVAAQDVPAPPPAASEDEGGLQVTVTDENAWQDLSLAIPSIATDRDQPTAARLAARIRCPAPATPRSPTPPSALGAGARQKCWCRASSARATMAA